MTTAHHRSLMLVLLLCAGALPARVDAADKGAIEKGSAEEKAAGKAWSSTPDAALPDVLILGDSISIGYTLLVRSRLAGVANVFRPLAPSGKVPANCADTANGLANLDAWLGDRRWRVIHFNFGLHDLKYLDEKGRYVSPAQGRQVAKPDQYEANLRALVVRLKHTGAILVWASTTPVPDGSSGRHQGDEVVYNAVAKKVMEDNGVVIDDLCAVVAGRVAEVQTPRNVHFNDQGSRLLADSVTASITAALAQPWTPPAAKGPPDSSH